MWLALKEEATRLQQICEHRIRARFGPSVRSARAAVEDALESKSKNELAGKAIGWAYRMRRRAATVAAAVLALALGYYVVAGQNGLHAYQMKRQEHQKLQQQIDALKQQNAQMQQKIHALKDDPDTIEREARERLHYARPDEVIVTIPQAKKDGSKGQ